MVLADRRVAYREAEDAAEEGREEALLQVVPTSGRLGLRCPGRALEEEAIVSGLTEPVDIGDTVARLRTLLVGRRVAVSTIGAGRAPSGGPLLIVYINYHTTSVDVPRVYDEIPVEIRYVGRVRPAEME